MGYFEGKMKIWYIVALAVLAVVCIVCMILGLALPSGGKYYELTFEEMDGVAFVGEILPGAKVKDGTEVKFSLDVDYDKVTREGDDLIVMTNDQFPLDEQTDADGKKFYSFVINRNTNIKVTNLTAIGIFKITFDEGEFRTRYSSDDGDTKEGISVKSGERVSFEVIQSAYYVGEPTVCANTTVIEPNEEDGKYYVDVTEDINVTVTGLKLDKPFYEREDGGNGKLDNPYRISRPIDLYTMADLIAEGFYTNIMLSHFLMTDDIDMKGEQLYVIGDATTKTSLFAGTFNGGGHKISNYFMEDFIIEQATYTEVKLPYVGLFGYVASTEYGRAEISNVQLENFEIRSDRTGLTGQCTIGGIAGYAIGADIIGCYANGTISAVGSKEIFVVREADKANNISEIKTISSTFVGGIVGAIGSSSIEGFGDFYASVRSCATEVEIVGREGYVSHAGGIAGLLGSDNEKNSAAIINCYSTGNTRGAIYAGGILGFASQYCSVLNCYSTGDVSANSRVEITGDAAIDDFCTSYAGGLVGYLHSGGVVANSFTRSKVSARSATTATGHAFMGKYVGYSVAENRANLYDAGSYVFNCFTTDAESSDAGFRFDNNSYKNLLKWERSDWVFGEGYPKINFENSTISYTVTVNFVEYRATGIGKSEESAYRLNAENIYLSMSFWNELDRSGGKGLPEFHNWKGMRSFGYFFDEELTQKVPYSFVPTGNITLYAGFADYSSVAGVYYLRGGDRIILDLGLDGSLLFRDGAQSLTTYYTYDGRLLRLYDNVLFAQKVGSSEVTLVGELISGNHGGELRLLNVYVQSQNLYYSAIKEIEGFEYGTYYSGDVKFEFGKGSVMISGMKYDGRYNYYVNKELNALTVNITERGNSANIIATLTASIEDGVVKAISGLDENDLILSMYNKFVGTWELPITAHIQYTFDKNGNWKFESFGYNGNGVKSDTVTLGSGTYTVAFGIATLNNANGSLYSTAEIKDGYLVVNDRKFASENSFAGKWLFSNKEPVEIAFNGISTAGYGFATIDYGVSYGELEVTYHFRDGKVTLFLDEIEVGQFEYSKADKTLHGTLFMLGSGSFNKDVTLCLYDSFKGVWVSGDSTLSLVEFNGLGNYDLKGTENRLALKGNIKICGVNVGTYTVINGTLKGTFEYGGKTYTLEYDYERGIVIVDGTTELIERDSLYGNTLIDDSGKTYTFDGRGLLTVGGTLTVEAANGNKTEYNYKLVGDTAQLFDMTSGNAVGSFLLETYMFTLDGEQNVQLFVSGDFEGTWAVGGTKNDVITIGKVYVGNTAQGTYNGNTVKFRYDAQNRTLSFTFDGANILINAHKAAVGSKTVTELKLTVTDVHGNVESNHVCLRSDADYFDEYRGEYVGENATVVLDGLMYSNFGSGTALVVFGENDAYSISYEIDSFGHIVFVSVGRTYNIFIEREGGEFTCGDKSYDLVIPSKLYDRTLYGLSDKGEIDKNVTYIFDGVDSVYDKNLNLVFTYEFKEQTEEDKLELVYRLVFTDSAGKKYEVVVDYSSTDYTLSLKAI